MISCKEVAEQLLRFRDGTLPETEMEGLRTHLHMCPPCLDLFEGYDDLVQVLERLRPVNMPPDFLARMKKCLQADPAGD
jgi:hypothetical protein